MKRRSESSPNVSSGDCSSGDGELKIDISPTPRRTRGGKSNSKRPRKIKKNNENAESECELEKCLQALKMNNHLEYTAVKNNLTVANVRNLLKRVVSNEHVLAIVKLKESEEIDEEEDDNPLHKIPTLTRSKAKELQQKDLPVVWPLPVSPVQPASSEVAVLINEDLPEDSSDEEYQPHDEENNSDDDKESATISDVDSLPNTPATPSSVQDARIDELDTNWTDDGLFKIPQSTTNEEQNIALRTRSKLCLSSTNIETIEKAFVPPDITSDMYDCEDIDGVWKDFLNKFTEPLPQSHDDDEDTDPEYNVQVDDVPVDKEELREDPEVTVSRRELSDLVAELFDMDSILDESVVCNELTQEQQNEICSLDVRDLTQVNETVKDRTDALINNIVSLADTADIADLETMPNQGNAGQVQAIEVEEIDEFEQLAGTDIIITPVQRLILAQQLRQHVQLTTQHFMQLYGHPELWNLADVNKENLIHLLSLADNNPNSAFIAHNLNEAIELCENWQERLSKDNDETKNIYEFITSEIQKSRASKMSHNRYYSRFPPQMMDAMCDSKVFIYPELLPKIPFRLDLSHGGIKSYTSSEEEVLAIELSLYFKYIEDNPELYKKGKRRSYRLQTVVELIEKYLRNGRTAQSIASQIRNRNSKLAKDNAIKYYFTYKKPPPTKHVLIPFHPISILPLRKQAKDNLPHAWREHIEKPLVIVKRKEKPPCFLQKPLNIPSALERNYTIVLRDGPPENTKDVNKQVNHTAEIGSEVMKLNSQPTISNYSNTPIKSTFSSLASVAPSASLPILYTSPHPTNAGINYDQTTSTLLCTNQNPMPLVTIISSTTSNLAVNSTPLYFAPLLHSLNNDNNLSLATNENCSSTPVTKHVSEHNGNECGLPRSHKNTPLKHLGKSLCVCKCNCIRDEPIKGQKLLTEYFKPIEHNALESESIRMNLNTNTREDIAMNKNDKFNVIWRFSLYVRKYFHNILNNLQLIYNVNYKQKSIKETFIHLMALEFFISLYFPKMLPSMPSLISPDKQDAEVFQNTAQNLKFFEYGRFNSQENSEKERINLAAFEESDENCDDADDGKKAKNRTPKSSLAERRKQKSLRESKIVRDMLTKQPDLDDDMNYAQLYYEKVQDRLNAQDSDDLKKFHDIVESVANGEDPSEVYRKLETIFLPNHPDLLEQFLTFLQPGQAAKIGKFMEHFLISNMDKFVHMINVYFSKQPVQIRKIYTALSELSDIPNVSMDDVKSSILPLLKGNQLLVEWFLQLFPTEKPPDSDISEFERLDFDKMDSSDMFDHVVVPEDNDDPYGSDNCICKCHNSDDEKYKTRYLHCIPCGMKYIQGRVYIQTGKRLRPATVTFDGAIPMSDHIKRLSAKPKPCKRRAEGSPTKLLLSPNKSSGSSSEEHRLDMSTDNEDDSKRSPKKHSKLYKTMQSKCRIKQGNSLAHDMRDCHVVIKEGEFTSKDMMYSNQDVDTMDACNMSAPDSTDSLLTTYTDDRVSSSTNNNIQVNICDSTETEIVANRDRGEMESNVDILKVFIPSDDLNVSMESDDKASPGSVASSDDSACSDSDVSVHSEKSDLINSDSSSIDDTEENSNDSDVADTPEDTKSPAEDDAAVPPTTETDALPEDPVITENHVVPKKEEIAIEEPIKSTADNTESNENAPNNDEKINGIDSNVEETDNIWTRDEDKIVLQTFQEQCDFDSTLCKICELLPHKNMEDIKNRFQVLLNLLQKISAQ